MSSNIINLTPYINKRRSILDYFKKADAFYEDIIAEALDGDNSAWQMLELEFDRCQPKHGFKQGASSSQSTTANIT